VSTLADELHQMKLRAQEAEDRAEAAEAEVARHDLHGVAEAPEITERDMRSAERLHAFMRLRNKGGWPAQYENLSHAVWGEHDRAEAAEAEVTRLTTELERAREIVSALQRFDEHFSGCNRCYGAVCRTGDTLLAAVFSLTRKPEEAQ